MSQFILRRLLVTIPVLLGIMFIVFVLARLDPGDPCRAVLGERATDAVCDDFIRRYGLDQPIPVQFVAYLQQLAGGDLGTSIKHSRPVTTAPRRAPADDHRADDHGHDLRRRRRRPARSHLRVPPQLDCRRWDDGLRQPRRVDAGLRPRALLAYLFAIILKDTPFSLPAIGASEPRASRRAARRGLGLEDWTGPPRGILDFLSGLYIFSGIITGQFGRSWTPSGTSSCRPSRWARSRSPSSPGSRARACSRSWVSTTSDRAGQGARAQRRPATRCAQRAAAGRDDHRPAGRRRCSAARS